MKPKPATVPLEEIRTAVADYLGSEGCSCCRGADHDKNQNRLAELLNVPAYSDGSGNNFNSFRSDAGKPKPRNRR